MKQFKRRASAQEILSLPPYRPHYQTAEGRRQNIDLYEKKCLELLDKEAKKYPGYNIRMTIKNGIPRFSYLKKSLTGQAVERRIKRTLSAVKKDVVSSRPKEEIIRRIDRTLARVEAALWDE